MENRKVVYTARDDCISIFPAHGFEKINVLIDEDFKPHPNILDLKKQFFNLNIFTNLKCMCIAEKIGDLCVFAHCRSIC